MKLPKSVEAAVLKAAGERPKPRRPRTPEVLTGHPLDFSMTLSLPCRVVSEANQRVHWAVKAKRAQKQRERLRYALRELGYFSTMSQAYHRDFPFIFPATVTFTHIGPELDDDNLRGAFKALRDEVATWAGRDDRDPSLVWQYRQIGTHRPDEFHVEITFKGAC